MSANHMYAILSAVSPLTDHSISSDAAALWNTSVESIFSSYIEFWITFGTYLNTFFLLCVRKKPLDAYYVDWNVSRIGRMVCLTFWTPVFTCANMWKNP